MPGGFCIREYTSRMRSVNVVNCWPFDETFGEETVKSLLPSIVVKRFTWWLDELQLLHSETAEKLKRSEKKSEKVLEKGETSSRNVDRDSVGAEESVKAVKVKSLKGKMRAMKKRSIVDIFAVAPPVKRAMSLEEEKEEDASYNPTYHDAGTSRARRNNNRRSKKMNNTNVILRKAMRVVKKIKKKKKATEKRCGDEIGVPEKNCSKHQLHAQEKATRNSRSSCSKESNHVIQDCVSNPKRKARLHNIGPYKKFVPRRDFSLIEKNQHQELPVRGILKSQSEESSLKQMKKCLEQKAVQLNDRSTENVKKHVTFLENDELVRPSRKPSQSAECFKLQEDCGSGIGSVDYAVAVGKDSTSSETSGSEDASTGFGKEVGDGSASNELLTMLSGNSTTLGNQKYEGEYSTRSESSERSAVSSLDQHWADHDLRDASHNTVDVCPPGFLHMPHDAYYNSQNVKVITTSSNTTCRRLSKDLGTSMSHLSNMKRTCEPTQASSEETAIDCAHSIHFQTFPHLSPNEQLQTFCSLPNGSQTGDISWRSTNGINEEFVGLPLNSQGDLMMLNSSAEREVNQMMNSNISAAPCHCIGLSLPSNVVSMCLGHHSESDYRNSNSKTPSRGRQLNLFPVESYVKDNAIAIAPSRLGIIESQSEKSNPDIDFPEFSYHPYHNSGKRIYRGDNQVQKGPENERGQPTMRLMGKEFEIGERSIQGFEDEGMWKDKQMIDELHFQQEPSLGELRETLFCPSEVANNHSSKIKYALPQTYRSLFPTRTVDSAQSYYPSLSPGTYSDAYNSKSLSTGYDSEFFTLELPKASAPVQQLCSNMSPSSIQLKNKQNKHSSPISAFKFPFMSPDLDGKSSWPRRSSLIQQPLCFDVSEKASQSCTLGHNHPYPKPGTGHVMNSSVPLPSGSALQSMDLAPLTPLPYCSGVLPVSALQRKYRNQNQIQERFKSRIGRELNMCKKSKGLLSALSNPQFKPLKRPTLGFHEGLQCAVRKPTACVSFQDSVGNMEDAFRSPSATQHSRIMMSVGNDETNKDGQTQTILPFVDPYSDTARRGPIKLTSGSKHIFKACQQKDQGISLSAANIGFRFS